MKEKIKRIVGDLLICFLPKKAAELSQSGMTIANGDTFTRMDYLMREALLRKAEKNHDFDALAEFQRAYWVNQGQYFFASTDDSFEKVFLPYYSFIFDILQTELAKTPEKFNSLVEIGTGNGKVLDYLSSKFTEIETFIGIDLSIGQIEANKVNYQKNTRLEFIGADAYDWVKTHRKENSIFITSGGVLEYFTEKRLLSFLKELNTLGKVIFVAIEPNGFDHDFAVNPNSQPYGHERSFSHNYAALFKAAGFDLWHESKKTIGNYDFFSSFIGAKN